MIERKIALQGETERRAQEESARVIAEINSGNYRADGATSASEAQEHVKLEEARTETKEQVEVATPVQEAKTQKSALQNEFERAIERARMTKIQAMGVDLAKEKMLLDKIKKLRAEQASVEEVNEAVQELDKHQLWMKRGGDRCDISDLYPKASSSSSSSMSLEAQREQAAKEKIRYNQDQAAQERQRAEAAAAHHCIDERDGAINAHLVATQVELLHAHCARTERLGEHARALLRQSIVSERDAKVKE